MTESSIANEICQFIKENLLAEGISLEILTELSSVGLDSFSLIEIVLFIERKYGVSLPDESLTPENTYSATTLAKCVVSFQ